MGARNFKSKEAYRKWLAYGHIHGQFAATPGSQKVKIRGKPHKVHHSSHHSSPHHSSSTRRKQSDSVQRILRTITLA
jgi:hypothetical protein